MKVQNYHITIGNATDTGKVRNHNEDYMAHFETALGYCIIVCDGMGGHAAGEVASQTAINSIQQFLQDTKNKNTDIPIALKNAIEFANYQLREMVNQNEQLKGMGTTCVLALIKNSQLYTAHAGDSRIYRIRNGEIEQITKDHSVVQKLIDNGILTEAEAALSDKKNQINKAIGVFERTEPAVTEVGAILNEHDKLLLCSDGLTAHVTKEVIYDTVSSIEDVQDAALKLVELANDAGGSDNITVQLVHYDGKTNDVKRKRNYPRRKILFSSILIIFLLTFIWAYKYYKRPVVKDPIKSKTDSSNYKPVLTKKKIKP